MFVILANEVKGADEVDNPVPVGSVPNSPRGRETMDSRVGAVAARTVGPKAHEALNVADDEQDFDRSSNFLYIVQLYLCYRPSVECY